MVLIEVLYSDPFFGLYTFKHPGIHEMMEEFKCASDYHLTKIMCIKITVPGSSSSKPVHLEKYFSGLAEMEDYFKLIFGLYPGKVIFVKPSMPAC